MRILIVEDNPVNMELFRDLLEIKGHEIMEANTGSEAVSMAMENIPDLILMDIQLPDMDGWTATGKIKGTPATEGIPIVALTAHAMEGDREKAMEHGCDAYMSKPIDTRSFVSTIEEIYSSFKS